MWPIATDRVAWSVGLSVGHNCEPCKSGWTDRDANGLKEPYIRWGQMPTREGVIFRAKKARHA